MCCSEGQNYVLFSPVLSEGNQHSKLCTKTQLSFVLCTLCSCTYDKDRTLANLRRKGFMFLVQVMLTLPWGRIRG